MTKERINEAFLATLPNSARYAVPLSPIDSLSGEDLLLGPRGGVGGVGGVSGLHGGVVEAEAHRHVADWEAERKKGPQAVFKQ